MRKPGLSSSILFVSMLLVSTILSAQPDYQWMRQFDGYGRNDNPTAMTKDAHDNIYVGGFIVNTSEEPDYFIIKYDVNGVRKWVKTYDNGNDDYLMSLDYQGGSVYATGWSESGSDQDMLSLILDTTVGNYASIRYPAASETKDQLGVSVKATAANDYLFVAGTEFTTTSNPDLKVMKYQTNTAFVTQVSYNGGYEDDMVAMVLDGSSNVYVVGRKGESNGIYDDWVVIKYSSSLAQSWVNAYGSSGVQDEPTAITVDGSGNVYVTGGAVIAGQGTNYVTRKYNSAGTLVWSSTYNSGGSSSDIGRDIEIDGSYVYVAGQTGSNGSATVVKYDISSGSQVWAATYDHPGTNMYSNVQVELASGGNVYMSVANGDIHLVKFSSSGSQLSVTTFDGNLDGGNDQANIAMTIPADQSIVLACHSSFSTLNPTPQDFSTIKYNLGESLLQQAGLNPPMPDATTPSFSLGDNYPNPFNPTTTIEFSLTGDDHITLRVYDVLGREVKTLLDNQLYGSGVHRLVVDLSDLSSGSYIYKLTGNSNIGGVTKKMILVK